MTTPFRRQIQNDTPSFYAAFEIALPVGGGDKEEHPFEEILHGDLSQ